MRLRFCIVFLVVGVIDLFGQNGRPVHLFLPGRQGALELALPGFQVERGGLRPDGKQFTIAAKNPNGMYLTAFVEVAPHPATNQQVRDEWWGNLKKRKEVKMENQTLTDSANAARAEYIIHDYQGIRLDQESLHAYYGGNEIWGEVHISKTNFQPSDQKLFEQAIMGVRMLPAYTLMSMDEMVAGGNYYNAHDYYQAAQHYQKALDLEKDRPTLSNTMTRVLVDQLGMSYGISHELAKSKAVFEYGISRDPEYPLFYYNIACGYGEQSDRENALVFLKKAFERKANVLKGEAMPNPLTDDSFKNLISDPTFVKEVKAMQQ